MDVAEHDESGRNSAPREEARLRATFAKDPGSGYAFHDEGRVERLRPSSPTPERTPGNARMRSSVPIPAPVYAANEPEASSPALSFRPPAYSVEERPAPVDATPTHDRGAPKDGGFPEESHVRDKPWIDPGLVKGARNAPITEEPTVPIRTRPSYEDMPTGRHGVSPDARLARLEPMIARSAWDHVLVELTHEHDLPPALALIRLIARREIQPSTDSQQRAATAAEATQAMAALLGVQPGSPVALLLAKRVLRRNPRKLGERQAGVGVTLLLVVLGVLCGVGAGFLATRYWL